MEYKIIAKTNYSGTMFSTLQFIDGVAYTSNPTFLAYFKRHDYKIEEIKKEVEKTETETVVKKTTRSRKKKEVAEND